jgi:protoporphyrinogen oxidase
MRTLEDYIIAFFGKELGEFNMLNYNRKIWGLPGESLHPEFVKQRVKGLSLTTALKNALFKNAKNKPKSLVDAFYYPRFGTGQIYEAMAQKIKDNGSEIITNSETKKIEHNGKRITFIEINISGENTKIEPKILVNSAPITEFLKTMDPLPPSEVMKAASRLKWRSQVYLFITLNKKSTCSDNWIYFPNEDVPFARYTEMHNFSPEMNPKNKTIVVLEFFTSEKEGCWQMNAEKLLDISLPHLEKANLIKKDDIRKIYAVKKRFAYPIYDIDYPKNLKIVKNYLDKFENLIYIGRPGRFHYNNQDHSLETGLAAAEIIMGNTDINLDKIGSEEGYFESGELKKNKKF